MQERIERLTEGNSEAEGIIRELFEEFGSEVLSYLEDLSWGPEKIVQVFHEVAGEDLYKMYAAIYDAYAEEDLS